MSKLTADQLKDALHQLQFNWQRQNGMLTIELKVKDFDEGIWVLKQVAQAARELNHHPDMELKNYNRLKITTTTHDSDGLTHKDLALAEKVDAIITRINKPA